MARTTKTRLGIDTLEARDCPALFAGGDDYCGTPWPRPLVHTTQVTVANPAVAKGIIAINPGTVKVIIIEGG